MTKKIHLKNPFNVNALVINKYKKTALLFLLILVSMPSLSQKQMENLDRGVVAVRKNSSSVLISWRIFASEFEEASYNIYRGSVKLNGSPITDVSNYTDNISSNETYSVSAVINGAEQELSAPVDVWNDIYKLIPLSPPSGGITPNGSYTYEANDASVGDLDGDGQYEIILKWMPSNSKDNSHSGYTGNTILQGLKLNGDILWTIDLGVNIRSGAHYTQFMVYDLDGDGKSELVCKTADGTKDNSGTILGDPNIDYRNSNGYVLYGPEYLSVFSGETGNFIDTVDYIPARGTVSDWGDSYGNRVDRFLACVAYLDGTHPSVVFCRGYYTRTVLAAWDFNGTNLQNKWVFDSDDAGSQYESQGNHSIAVGDVDGDDKDEIVYGAMVIDDNGQPLNSSGYRHGDAAHLGDFDPSKPGLEYFTAQESAGSGAYAALGDFGTLRTSTIPKVSFRGNQLGEIFWQINQESGKSDVGRCTTADIDPNYLGAESWSSAGGGIYDVNGNVITTTMPISSGSSRFYNMLAWWDGDLLREFVDKGVINKWDATNDKTNRLVTAYNYDGLWVSSNNGTKSTPCLIADILGDWREEIIWRTNDSSNLVMFSTPNSTSERIFTLMHDPLYRTSIAWQNVAYNQPAHTSFYLGSGMLTPPTPNIYLANSTLSIDKNNLTANNIKIYPNPTSGEIFLTGINNGSVQVYNVLGKLILKQNTHNLKSIKLKGNSPGLYTVKIIYESGVKTFKVILK